MIKVIPLLLVVFLYAHQEGFAADGSDVLDFIPAILAGVGGEPPPPPCPGRAPDSSPNIVFEEQFDTFSPTGPKWMVSNVIPKLDKSRGSPGCPSLLLQGGTVTTNAAWSTANGLDVRARVRISGDSVCPGSASGAGWAAEFQVRNLAGGTSARVSVGRNTCRSSGGTYINYWLNGDRLGTPDVIAWSLYTGRFLDLRLRIFSNGDMQWFRDGNLRASSFKPLVDTNVRIMLSGGGSLIPNFETNFDNIRVYR